MCCWTHAAATRSKQIPADPWALPRLVTTSDYGAASALGNSVYPLMIADIHGDWREEVLLTNAAFDELLIFTTDQPLTFGSTRWLTTPSTAMT